MNKKYKGLKENGCWENFTSDNQEDAKPENSGYEKVIDLETEKEIE